METPKRPDGRLLSSLRSGVLAEFSRKRTLLRRMGQDDCIDFSEDRQQRRPSTPNSTKWLKPYQLVWEILQLFPGEKIYSG